MAEIVDKAKKFLSGAGEHPEGIATAALGAFLFNPVVGLALGLGQGILAKRERKTALELAAEEREMLASMDDLHRQSMEQLDGRAATDLDREQLMQMGRDYKAARVLAMSSDPETRRNALVKMSEMSARSGDWLEDLEGRNEAQMDADVTILDEQGAVARANYERGLSQAQAIQQNSSEFHQLLSQEDFDPNNPVSRARLGQLLDQTPREFLADPADMSDALEKVGANAPGVIGALVQYYAGKKKAEEFTFTKEDWRKVAFAMNLTAKKRADRIMSDAERIGTTLDRAATGIGHKPALSYLDRIITGEVQEGEDIAARPGIYDEVTRAAAARRAAAADAAEAAEPSRASKVVADVKQKAKGVVGRFLEMTGWEKREMTPEEKARRPTN